MKQWLVIGVCLMSGVVHAQEQALPGAGWPGYVQVAVAMSSPDAQGDSDLGAVLAWDALLGYQWRDAWSVELRVARFGDAKHQGADNVGTYTLSLSALDLGLGVRWRSQPIAEQWRWVARAGVLRYRVDAELTEQFYDLREGGQVSRDQQGSGAYLGAGGELNYSDRVKLDSLLYYTVRDGLFEQSPKGFDLTDWRIAVGMQYLF